MTRSRLIAAISLLIWLSNSSPAFAQANDATVNASFARSIKGSLQDGRKLLILITGNDTLFARLMEDALAIRMENAGLVIFGRDQVERAVAQQLATQKQPNQDTAAIGAAEIAKKLGANLYLVGSAIVELPQDRDLRVRSLSVQLVDPLTEGVLARVLIEWKDGASLSAAAKQFADTLNAQDKTR